MSKNDKKPPLKQPLTKKASSYNMIKGSKVQLSPFCCLYQIYKRDSDQRWHAKVIDDKIINQYALSQCLQFNLIVLENCRELENIIYVEEMFTKSGSTFIIQQQYDKTLIDRVNDSYPVFSAQIEQILCDVLSGLLELYKQKYMTRSLRPEHIVCVEDVWKIQSLVLNSEMHAVESQYCWSEKFASPEDRSKVEELSERIIDEQLVWNIGILGLYMILGPNFQYDKINKDSFIPWNKVKDSTGESLYRFLVKALKVDFKDRMKLSQLLQNEIFADVNSNQTHPFLSYSKYFGSEDSDKLKKPPIKTQLTPQSIKKMQILQNDIDRFRYFGQVERFTQELPYKTNFDNNLIKYLSFKIAHENLTKIKNQIVVWKRQTAALRSHPPLKEIEEDLNILINKMKQSKINYSKSIRGIQVTKSQVNQIRKSLNKDIVDERILYNEVVDLYLKLAGSIYTLLSKDCQKDENKQRTICYYSLGAYLIYFYEPSKFKNVKNNDKDESFSLTKFINEYPIVSLVEITQNLTKEYFATNTKI